MPHPANDLEQDNWERFARFFGTKKFILVQTALIVLWIAINVAVVAFRWDPYPFILLNLVFSTQAAYAAPILQLAANRQAQKDAVRDDLDHEHMTETHRLVSDVHRWLEDNPEFPTPAAG